MPEPSSDPEQNVIPESKSTTGAEPRLVIDQGLNPKNPIRKITLKEPLVALALTGVMILVPVSYPSVEHIRADPNAPQCVTYGLPAQVYQICNGGPDKLLNSFSVNFLGLVVDFALILIVVWLFFKLIFWLREYNKPILSPTDDAGPGALP